MLEKITNISPNSDFKKSAGTPKYYKKVNSYTYTPGQINDSILISPATALLATYGWKLKKINQEADKIHIIFELDGFLFDTNIQFNDLKKNPFIEYKIQKDIDGFAAEITVIVILVAPVRKKISENELEKTLNALNEFFEQFKSLSVKKPNIITDQHTIDSLSSDFMDTLNKEFNYINSCLLRFLDKYVSLKIWLQNESENELIGEKDGLLIKSIHIK